MRNTSYFKFFIFFALFIFSINAINSQIIIEKIIKVKADRIWSDKFDKLYVLSENALFKYNSKGIKQSSFYTENGENISFVDTRNEFKIIVFIQEYNKVVILDNNLTKVNNGFYLEDIEVLGDVLISGATNGGYWIYNNANSQLLKLNLDFKIEYTKDMDISDDIISITENSQFVILQKKSREFISYNYNTGLKTNMPIYKASDKCIFIDNEVIYYSGNIHGLTFFNWMEGKYRYIKLPKDIDIADATLGKFKIFFYDNTKVYISKIKS